MQTSSNFSRRLLPALFSLFVLGLLVAYSYAYIFKAPYSGFFNDPNTGEVISFYLPAGSEPTLHQGDMLLQIGPVTWEQHYRDKTSPLFEGVVAGQTVILTVQRNGETLTIPWVFPGFNREEFIARLINNWWLGYFFWFFGMIILLFMRPRDARWGLLIVADYLLALWLTIGNVSGWYIWGSALLLHALTWLMLPVFLNFHWLFPRPLKRISPYAWGALYGICTLLAVGQLVNILPASFYILGFLLMLVGSITLLIIHYARQADQRREIGLLAIALLIALTPSIILAISGIFGSIPRVAALALLALPIMPGAYLYATFRRSLGGMELRANRIISLVLYGVLLLSLAIPVAFLINTITDRSLVAMLALVALLLFCLVTARVYPSFQRWVERRLLWMPIPPASMLEAYMARITTSLEKEKLGEVLCGEVFPSLLVRQAALLRLGDDGQVRPICLLGVAADQLPGPDAIPNLLAESGRVRLFLPDETSACPWVRLVLPLALDGKPVGLCLLGRRDPDDHYAAGEIPTLQALMDQSALAIMNIEQSEHLHALYLADIERQEAERSRLALELHDDVLGQMALLALNAGEGGTLPQFDQAYQAAVSHIREIVTGLRPAMLNYGLWSALDEMADGLKPESEVSIRWEVANDPCRYPQMVELHLFRIVQQACQNALQHAHARNIRVAGNIHPEGVDLLVEDDGVGFPAGVHPDLPGLLAGKHFGLAGMVERAALIGAQVKIESEPGIRTCVSLVWHSAGKRLRE